jgi:hypothetical protein
MLQHACRQVAQKMFLTTLVWSFRPGLLQSRDDGIFAIRNDCQSRIVLVSL